MTNLPISTDKKLYGVFEKQWITFSLILFSLIIFYYLSLLDVSFKGFSVLNLDIDAWYWIAFFTPIVHQLYVWLCWRLQLYYNLINKIFGLKVGFNLYAIGFGILFVFRFISILILSYANQGTLEDYKIILWLIIILILPLILYSFYSVKEYFGMKRAFGLDHFDPVTHSLPMVNKGMYKFVNNSMYWFALQALFLPGLFYASFSGILVGAFNYCFIWVHYYTVEKPDMKKIYS